jgi:fused signal recognition particle receptor
MFDFLKKRKNAFNNHDTTQSEKSATDKSDFAQKMKSGLQQTRYHFQKGLHQVFRGDQTLSDTHFKQIKETLLAADVGLAATQDIVSALKTKCQQHGIVDPQRALTVLKEHLVTVLHQQQKTLTLPTQDTPVVLLLVGMNGAGKTTTIGKLAKRFQAQDKKVMLAAGDTFRAAAIEQLQIWGQRHDVPVVAQQPGADSGAVLFDALQSATQKGIDVLLADTAGRLHTKHNLMAELKKIKKVMKKIDPQAPHEVLLVLDASIGQNSLQQAKHFHEALDVTGLIMTKLDGTAKGGALIGIAQQLAVPIYMLGVGEQAQDLQNFDALTYVEAIFPDPSSSS